ncbi:lysozyme C-like [Toxotes jaculatrix]|uniref:lysozyme C-like n=1 Tax=Toxotes jaculatrix TaxID=941984 RepID=UPI001B3A8CDD|nr:lysozyme C-like [Toxotes jaculatrix]
MKVLVVFLLAALGCSLAEGWLVSKCDLRDQLVKAIGDLTEMEKQKGLTGENLVAKIVCHVELASGFNTSAVNELIPGLEDHHHRSRRGARNQGHGGKSSSDSEEQQHTRQPPSHTRPPPHEEIWTLYGLFQLSDHLVCSDGTTSSPNICGINCSNLIDDDIRDDISCVLKILTNLVEKGFGAANWEELKRMIRFIFQEACRDKQASDYFAECP